MISAAISVTRIKVFLRRMPLAIAMKISRSWFNTQEMRRQNTIGAQRMHIMCSPAWFAARACAADNGFLMTGA